MLSMISQPISFNDNYANMKLQDAVDDKIIISNFHDAIEPFTKLVLRSRITSTRLLCTIPTWGSSDDNDWDLHDLQELRSRFLAFIHEVVKSLRSAGIVASYSLAPASSSQCLVVALPSNVALNQRVINEVEKVRLPKSNSVSLIESKAGPCIVIN